MRCGITSYGQRASRSLEGFRALWFVDVREFAREDDCRVLLVLDPISPRIKPQAVTGNLRAKRALRARRIICASLAWHFYESSSLLQFRGGNHGNQSCSRETSSSPSCVTSRSSSPAPTPSKHSWPSSPLRRPFQIIVTSQPRLHPASVWSSSYVVFLEDPVQ